MSASVPTPTRPAQQVQPVVIRRYGADPSRAVQVLVTLIASTQKTGGQP
jgi:hypothetical protein